MNSFRNGHGFIVYGINQSAVQAATTRSSFGAISQRGDALQLVSLDIDIDGDFSTTVALSDLTRNVQFYGLLCVEYMVIDDRQREVSTLTCSDGVTFTLN